MATIRRRGRKWHVQVRRLGSSPVTKSFHALKDAQEWARHKEIQADRRDLPRDPKVLEQTTLANLITRYRDTITPHKRTQANESIILNAFLKHPICRLRLSELRTEDFVVYRDERLQSIKPSSLKRALVPIQHMFKIAKDEWGLPLRENPLAKLKINGADVRRERRLKPGELDRLIQAAGKCRNQLILPVILFALATGMRRSEILSARWDHVDRAGRSLLIPHSKNGRARIIPLAEGAFRVLNTLHSTQTDYIFPVSPNGFRLSWNRLRQRAGISDLHFHDCRHEAISTFFEKGLSTPEVALISGHRDMRMLFRYSHAMREKVLEKLNASEVVAAQ